ncbi:MAG: hypothetical protein QNJ38_04825 [Prochloraceae cyanobacterium]|nr:hypothetical protein [Prochloraceae cyanobacterium]
MENINHVKEYYQVFYWLIAGILITISIALFYHFDRLIYSF